MKTLKIDEKWSVEYDPQNNDRPVRVLRYGQPFFSTCFENNIAVALFYALLAKECAALQELPQ